MDIEKIAKITHEANRAWCQFNGDNSQETWENSPDWQKQSAISGVKFHLENPNANDSASHEEWLKFKLSEGWVYGEFKDAAAKTHPCMVPFDQLPRDQQFKDKLFRTLVHASR